VRAVISNRSRSFLFTNLRKVTKLKDDKDYADFALAHRNVGYLCLVLMLVMAIGGFLLGDTSNLASEQGKM